MSLLQSAQSELIDLLTTESNHSAMIFPSQNLTIYRQHLTSILVKALRQTYPLIEKLLGEDFFQQLAMQYIEQYPSRSSNLHDYGEYFCQLLADQPFIQHLAYLCEVAEFEWICHSLTFAANPSLFDMDVLAALSPEQYPPLHAALHPASVLKKFQYPILKIIDLCDEKIEELNADEEGPHLLIIRRDTEINLAPLTAAEFAFLSHLQNDASLGEALEKTLLLDSTFNLEQKLPQWIQDTTIVEIEARSEMKVTP